MILRKGIYGLLAGVLLLSGTLRAAEPAAETNLLPNGSFEQYECNALGCSFEGWSFPLGVGNPNTTDKIDGEVSMQMVTTFESVLDNAVALTDVYYEAGALFKITLNYKVISLPKDGFLKLDCYWEPSGSGDADEMRSHDADELQTILTEVAAGSWEKMELTTSKPYRSSRLRVRIIMPKKANVLFDDFRVEETLQSPDEPYIRVSPLRLSPVSTTLGMSVDLTSVHITQGNVTGTTTFELSGYDTEMFSLSASSMPADKSEMDLVVTYKPTKAGTHTAVLNIDNLNHTVLFHSITVSGTCVDPTQKPSVSVTPNELPLFTAIEGQDMRDTIHVTTHNCIDYAYLRVDHIEGAAFTVDGSMLSKNSSVDIQVRFAPTEAGDYQSLLTVYSEGADPVTIELNGKGIKRNENNIDWQTKFVWDYSHPLTLMNETFDQVNHNKTLVLDGWQNVAPVDERPWWGFDEEKTSPKRGKERYAKATAYQYAKDSTGLWESWLVTPALDYKNAEGKIFAFSVMGEYLPEDGLSPTALEIYYVAPVDDKVAFQNLTGGFSFPYISEDNNIWRTYYLNLEPYSESIADVFHIAFRYVGPNGGAGAVTYFLDEVSWGRTDLPQIVVNPTYIIDSTSIVGKQKILAEVTVTGKNLTHDIELGVAGTNYKRFELSTGTLPAEGGKFLVLFEGLEAGVHEAYVVLSSKNAPETLIPMAVLCKNATGVEEVQIDNEQNTNGKVQSTKLLREGQLIILRGNNEYNVLGIRIR